MDRLSFVFSILALAAVVLSGLLLNGCSAYMIAHEPDRIELSWFKVGEARSDVIQQLSDHGEAPNPQVSAAASDSKTPDCETYELYTDTPDEIQRTYAVSQANLADEQSAYLSEIFMTPFMYYVRTRMIHPHAVEFCYRNNVLTKTPWIVNAAGAMQASNR